MGQLWSSSSDLVSAAAGKKEEKCALSNLSSSCFIHLQLFFSFSLFFLLCFLSSFLLQLVDTVLSSSRLLSVLAFVLSPARGIAACQSSSKTLYTQLLQKSRVGVSPSVKNRCSVPIACAALLHRPSIEL